MSRNEEFAKGRLEEPAGFINPDDDPSLIYTAIPIHRNVMEPVHVLAIGRESQIGRLTLKPDGTVDHVFVNPKDRRQGHATRLWRMARHLSSQFDNWPEPKHSSVQTDEGREWARKVGE
jgi:hypothetical protein